MARDTLSGGEDQLDDPGIATEAYADAAANTEVSTHNSDTTAVHGVANTAKLLTSPESGLKVIRGIIDGTGSGSIVEGSGFTISIDSDETYDRIVVIDFTANFSDIPTVLAEPAFEITAAALLLESTTSDCSVVVTTDGNTFHFIAIGPA